jgi:hypothetical protein
MRVIVLSTALAFVVGMASSCFACNGHGGNGGSMSSGGTNTAALQGLSALRSGSFGTSSPTSQLALQELANQRILQMRYQQMLAAQQQSTANQGNQVVTSRAEQLKQSREEKIAKRKAREAALQAKRDELKAKNLAKQATGDATTQVASGE